MTAGALDRERLARVLGMLGSAHDGEALAAARQAERLRAEAGLTWAEIVIRALPAPSSPQPCRYPVAEATAFLFEHWELLTDWEIDFVESLRRQRYPLSQKQREVLDRLVVKVHRADARAA
jgi:hypothetical protein